MSELLPCPFCQSPRVHVTHIRDGLRVSCKDCLGEGPPVFYGTKPKVVTRDWAVRDWNRYTKAEPDPLLATMAEALRDAERFIDNGIELGYIAMPAPSLPDPAHSTLPTIRAALSAYRERTKG